MNAIKTTMTLLVAVLACVSCAKNEKQDEKETNTGNASEQFIESYKQAATVGTDEVMKLVYRGDQLPEMVDKDFRAMIESDISKKLVSVEIVPFDQPDYDQQAKVFKGMGLMMPTKPTNMLKLTHEEENGTSSTSIPMGKMDGKYYLFTLIKEE